MSLLQEMFPLLIPIFVIDVILAVAAVRHILRPPHYRFGNRAMWLVISLIILMFGPIIYFVFGIVDAKGMCFLDAIDLKVSG